MQSNAAAAVLLAALTITVAQAGTRLPADVAEGMDAYLQARTDMGGFSGTVLLAQGDRVVFEKGYGYADIERRVPFSPTTPFEVASLTKMFTAMAALKLRDAGKLKLDDSICRYLSDCPVAWQPITVDELIHHTAGIHDYEQRLEMGSNAYFAVMSRTDATAVLYAEAKKRPLDFPPGSNFNYSNTGYLVLAQVVQSAAGERFSRYVREALLKPAGMHDSGVLGTGTRPAALAQGYSFGDVGWDKLLGGFALTDGTLRRVPRLALTTPAGDAGLYSDAEDLYRWSRIMDGSTLVSTAEAREVFTPERDYYGDGWIVTGKGTDLEYQHTGALPGYLSHIIKLPARDVTLVVLCNLDRARMSSITGSLLAMVLGKPYEMPVRGKPVVLSDTSVGRLVGDYRIADGEVISVSYDGTLLNTTLPGQSAAGLIPLSGKRFYIPLVDGEADFVMGPQGHASAVNLHYGGQAHPASFVAPGTH